MLRPTFPNVRLNIASDGFVPKPANDYARFILNLIRQWDLESTVTFLGVQNGKGLVDELRQAHCFVSPSFIENSSNALQEAMLVGIPCVTSSAGGASTIVDSERTGLTFPAGDAALLAHQMRRIFEDDDLAIRLGCNGEQAGRARNNPDKIVAEVLAAYKEAVTLKASVNVQ